jgi:hypothetical protein
VYDGEHDGGTARREVFLNPKTGLPVSAVLSFNGEGLVTIDHIEADGPRRPARSTSMPDWLRGTRRPGSGRERHAAPDGGKPMPLDEIEREVREAVAKGF